MFFFCKQETAYEMRISDWSSDVCSSDLIELLRIESVETAVLVPHPRRVEKDEGLDGKAFAVAGNERAVARLGRDRDAAVADHRAGIEAAPDGEVAARKFFIGDERVAQIGRAHV